MNKPGPNTLIFKHELVADTVEELASVQASALKEVDVAAKDGGTFRRCRRYEVVGREETPLRILHRGETLALCFF